MSPSLYLGVIGYGLIAVCYGFSRFAFGMFLPQVDANLSLSSTLSGLISSGSFLGYCIAITLSALLTERIGSSRFNSVETTPAQGLFGPLSARPQARRLSDG